MNNMNQKFNDRARSGFLTTQERVGHFLEIMMLHAAKHPWMRWASVRFTDQESIDYPSILATISCIS